MTRKFLKARDLLATRLNASVLDPFPGTRNGKHFLNEADGINLSRANTFPKGYILTNEDNPYKQVTAFSRAGFNERNAKLDIFYLVKDKISYTDSDNVKYTGFDYVQFMKEEILQTLQDNSNLGEGYYIKSILPISKVEELVSDEFAFKLYQIIISVEIKWVNAYGTNI